MQIFQGKRRSLREKEAWDWGNVHCGATRLWRMK
jgi:hypothetical protein